MVPWSRLQIPMKLDRRSDHAIAHLRVDVKHRRVGVIVGRSHSLAAKLYRLRNRLIFQSGRDAAASHCSRGCGESGRRESSNRGKLEEGESDDRLTLARDPEAIFADARVVERRMHPLVERLPWYRHSGRDVLLRRDHHLVELHQAVWITVLA